MRVALLSVLLTAFGIPAAGQTVMVEAESFADRGGWVVDQQSMPVMGTAYLLAHGLGVPVADAVTTVELPKPGEYRVFVRTKDWVARWNAPGTPGRFQVLIDGKPLDETFGTRGKEWSWHDGGTVKLDRAEVTLTLHDLTGFEGRCDAIVLSAERGFTPPNEVKELTAFRQKTQGLPKEPDEKGEFDLVVIGGGVPGCCTAVSAARLGLKVAFIQDRPVLGGNSSSEVRVWIGGGFCLPPYPAIGEILAEFFTRPKVCPDEAEAYGDDLKMKVVAAEENITLFLWEHANGVELEGKRIAAVVSTHVLTGRRSRFEGRWFVDCTGDGTIGYLAKADYETTEKGHLGASNLWYPVDTGKPQPFPRCAWALDLTDKPFPTELSRLGKWFWESGFDLDTIRDAEAIRDHNLRAMYGAWDNLKNEKQLYPNHKLQWAAYISGKRESRRLLGDVVLTDTDVLEGKKYDDGCVACTWSIDLHYPDARYAKSSPGNEFISRAKFQGFKKPYLAPYRCLYSRSVPNLFMAGRNISVTHEALGTIRVMATGGLMGEVVGRAAAICKKHDCDPRDVYEDHLEEFIQLLRTPTRAHKLTPPKFAAAVGENAAAGAKVTTSGNYNAEGSHPEFVNDGQADTRQNALRWLSKAGVPNWVELSWPEEKTITAGRVISGYFSGGKVGDPIADFVLQYHDGETWQDVPGTSTQGNTAVDWQRTFKPVTAKRVRLYVTATQIDVSRIWEVELYEAK